MEKLEKKIPKRIKFQGFIFCLKKIYKSFEEAKEEAKNLWNGGYSVRVFSGDQFTKKEKDREFHVIYVKEVV